MESVHADLAWRHAPDRGLCFAHQAGLVGPAGIDPTLAQASFDDIARLPGHLATALATLLRFLLCGEESATHAFGESLAHSLTDAERASLELIAREEAAHAWLIGAWIADLPNVPTAFDVEVTRRFFRRLQTRDCGLHFARVAALDAGVCRILSRLIRGAALAPYAGLRAGLSRIRSDEIRHVRVSRTHALRLGITRAECKTVAVDVEARLAVLLAPAQAAMRLLIGFDDPPRSRVDPSGSSEDCRRDHAGA